MLKPSRYVLRESIPEAPRIMVKHDRAIKQRRCLLALNSDRMSYAPGGMETAVGRAATFASHWKEGRVRILYRRIPQNCGFVILSFYSHKLSLYV